MATSVRLPTNIVPEHYNLSITSLDFVKFTFDGQLEISYKKTDSNPTSKLVLHVDDIKIKEGYVGGSKLIETIYDETSQTATLNFDSNLPQDGKISINYTGQLNDKLVGFYRTSVTIDDQKIYAGSTKFEPTDARRFLPCFDEPAIKATFSITVTYKRWFELPSGKKVEYIALSNSPILSQTGTDTVTVTFKTSPKMSTYLLALIVGPFEYVEKTDGKRPIRVYAPPGKKELGTYALDVACKSMQFYEKYFEVEYPLEKMDLIAVPDFTSGAMENWGLVTFRETTLLVDPENSSTSVKQAVAETIIHEIAHQWFGNLVTMEWWTHLWLNEGFAAFMENLCGNAIFPEFKLWDQFVANDFSLALELDAMHNSHPIEVPVNHPSEIREIFDVISYKKGASVIRMVYNYIGDEAFRKGMKDYLTKHAYKNTVTEDLWECLEAASNKPVSHMASAWTLQMGYPWLSVERSPVEANKVKLSMIQEKFSSDGIVSEEDKLKSWKIPISVVTGSNPNQASLVTLLDQKVSDIIVENANNSWIKLNFNSVSLIRVAYPHEMMEELKPAIANQVLSSVDRMNVQNDFFALCLAGKLDTVSYFKLLEAFENETSHIVWSSIDNSIGRLATILSGTDSLESFKAFGRSLYERIYKSIGWEQKPNESHGDSLLRSMILNRLASLDHDEFISEAKRRFNAHVTKEKIIPADYRLSIYRTISRFGNDQEFNHIFETFKSTEFNEEKNRAASSLGFAKDDDRLRRVVDFAFSNQIRDQDKIFVFAQLGRTNPNFAWNVFKEKKDFIVEKYQSTHLFRAFVKFATENFASEEKANEIDKFFKTNPYPQANRTVKQSLETIRLNANLLNRDGKLIKSFLSNLKYLK